MSLPTPYLRIRARTERLELRPLFPDDLPHWREGFESQSPPLTKYDEGWFDTSFMTHAWYLDKLAQRIELAARDESYLFNVFLQENGASVGNCDITTHMRGDYQYARVGYTIHNQHWMRGYATELLPALLRIGFEDLGFHRLEAHINTDNLPSKKVALSAGMCLEGVRERFILEDGVWTDNEVYWAIRG